MPATKRHTVGVLPGPGKAQASSSGASKSVEEPPFEQFSDLPQHLQSYILALGGAPLDTCKAAASTLEAPDLTATWLTASTPCPLESAAWAQKWDAFLHLLNSSSSTQLASSQPSFAAILGLASKHGRLDVVQRLVGEGAWAQVCESQHSRDSLLLLRNNAKPGRPRRRHTADIYTRHPLICAAQGGMADMVALLLNQPGTPVPASIGRQALCSAAEAGSIPTMQLLITSVPGISEPGIGYNPLTSAAAGGHIPALQFLLQQGAHPKNQHGTPFSYTPHLFSSASATCPLTAAVTSNRSVELIQFLLAQDVHWGGLSKALEEAAAAGNVQVVQLLLSNDANSDPYCYALYAAAKNKHTAVMRTLLQTGTGVSPKRVNSAFSGSAEVGDVEGLALLHQHGAEVNCTDGSTWHPKAPIQHASENNHAAAVQWLLDHGATTELSHLLEALQCGAADAAKQLVRHGVRDDCNTALLAAARRGFTDVVNLLLDAHLPEAHQEAARATVARLDVALCAASSFGRAAVVRSLLERLPAAFPPAASQLAGTSEEAAAAAAAASGLISGADCSTDEESSDGDPEQWDEPWPLWSAEDMENFDSGITEAEAQHRGSSPTPKQTGSRHRLLHRAMEAAAAGADYCPDHSHLGTFKQRVMECSKDKCLWRSAGLNDNLERHLGSNFAETIRLLVAAGVDPTYDDCRFLKRAAERDNCDMIDALLPLCAEHPAVVSGAVLLRAIKNGCLSAMYKLQSHSKPNRSMCHAMEKVMSEQIMGGLYKAMLMKWHTEAPSN